MLRATFKKVTLSSLARMKRAPVDRRTRLRRHSGKGVHPALAAAADARQRQSSENFLGARLA